MKKILSILTLTALSTAGASATVTATNLLAFYDFNGNTNDGSGNGATGALTDGAVISAAGLGYSGGTDSSLDLGPASGNVATDPHARMLATVNMSSATTNNSFAVSFWQFNIGDGAGAGSSVNVASSVFGLTGPTGADRGINSHAPWSNGQLYFDHGGPCCGGANRLNLVPPTSLLDAWHHIVLQVNNGNKQIWLDGSMIAEQAAGAAAVPVFTNDVVVGAQFNNILSMPGRLDEFAIWNVALEPSEIGALAGGASTLSLIPEPSSGLLILLSSLLIVRRRR